MIENDEERIENEILLIKKDEERIEREILLIKNDEERIEREILLVKKDEERIENEILLVEKDVERIERDIERLSAINAREKALSDLIRQRCFPPESCSTPTPSTAPGSKPSSP